MIGSMAIKNDHKRSLAAVLSSVVAEMAKPRVVESVKRAADTLAEGRSRSIDLPATETLVPPGDADLLQTRH
jgi:hypothetical protein